MQVSIESILGLKEKIGTPLDLVRLGDEGVLKSQIKHLGEAMCVPNTVLANLLSINVRTIQRQPEGKHFDRNVSDRAIKLAQLTARGIKVFGSSEDFCAWLQTPCLALGDKTPVSLLVSTVGTDMVDDVIGRIEYGVYS
jgi:putative toxin-antitoxin system antitoxin component (TIGR02293 family)